MTGAGVQTDVTTRYAYPMHAVVLLAALYATAPACSAPSEVGQAGDAPAAVTEAMLEVLDSVPEGKATRFILTLATDADGEVDAKQAAAVLAELQREGADAEWLEGTPVVFVTCDKQAVYPALASGYVRTVQVDQLRKPLN